ncbi:putative reverse transcriptase domain-containing protein [Tanacetum coccineum]
MVGTRQSTPEFSGPAFEAVVQRAVDALLPGLTTRLTNKIRQNGAGGIDAENWIAHIEKIFEVLGCADEFKARLSSYKLEGDALNWWKAFKQAKGGETYVAALSWKDFRDIFFLQYFPRSEQQKYEREYHTIRQRDEETSGELMKRFLRLAGFVGKKAGPPEEQAKHFKWALCDWILDGIVNTEFTDVAQVANAARNMEILREMSSQNNKRNRDGDPIRPTAQDSNQRGYDQKGYDGRSYDRQSSNSQKRYPDYASSPPCHICGKLYPGIACHRVTGPCFTCGSTGHMARDYPKNGGNGSRGNGNENQPAAKGQVFSSTKDQAAKSSVIIDHEYQNCPLRFDDKIRSANLFPLDMNDFDIKFWAWGNPEEELKDHAIIDMLLWKHDLRKARTNSPYLSRINKGELQKHSKMKLLCGIEDWVTELQEYQQIVKSKLVRGHRKFKTVFHVSFLEINESNGKGPDWMFDLDILSPSLNYIPVRKENKLCTVQLPIQVTLKMKMISILKFHCSAAIGNKAV